MPRTTLNLDSSVLRELKRLQSREHKSLGQIVSELLAGVLAERTSRQTPPAFEWASQPMHARVNLEDKEAVLAVVEELER